MFDYLLLKIKIHLEKSGKLLLIRDIYSTYVEPNIKLIQKSLFTVFEPRN